MPPPADVRGPVPARAVANRQIDDLESKFRRAEQEVEVSERVELAEVRAVGGDQFVISPCKHLGSAERVFHRLAQQPGERERWCS